MAHFQGQQHGQPTTRVDEYGNPVTAGTHGVGQTGGYGTTGTGAHSAGHTGYGATGTGTHDAGGYDGSGQPAGYGATGTGIHDAGGFGTGHTTGYGATGTGTHGTGHGAYGATGTGVHDAGGLGTGHTAGYGATGTGTHGTGHGSYGATGIGTHGGGQFQPTREEHKTGGILHRSGSSSSSSVRSDLSIYMPLVCTCSFVSLSYPCCT